ncbi:alpha/beta hydrolase [Streptomyces sp. NBC_01275]|uniref:alpha/beta fold hydrolase n=1 Tax=Streptomyces sp. NBC_01275 TaxID=2903807 RepID=UPI002258F5AF|nr:alpha/beta hydrolase [Streptomyces sp. NBC_01275]MCX4767451.1 alpha/beta hydrolase [Streptomyces sp. NBC_01275]
MPFFTAPDGTRLAYHVRGEGEPLVVLPGGPMRASVHLGDLGGLAAHRRLILLDLRGTGDSALPADPATYRCDRQVDDVEALRVHLGLERVDVLAHSAGGSLAMLYAGRYPHRVGRLALITVIPWALGRSATVADRLTAARLRADEPWFATAYPAFEAWLTGEGEGESEGDAGSDSDADDWTGFGGFFYGRWDDTARAHLAAADEQTNPEGGERFHDPAGYDPPALRAALAEVTAPVLVLAGEVDGGPRPELARLVADAFPNAEFAVQPGAGHYPWRDDPGWFVRRVEGFLG